jgi:nitrile hydratase accessory protein
MLFPTRARKAVLSRSLSIRSLLRWPSYFPSGQTPPTKFISTCGSGTLSGSNRLEPLADELRPAFNEPWRAEAYALVQVLIETDRISSSQWAKAFGAALREAAGQGEPDSSDTYYSTLSETLQRVLVAGGRVHDAEIRQRIDDWRARQHVCISVPGQSPLRAEVVPKTKIRFPNMGRSRLSHNVDCSRLAQVKRRLCKISRLARGLFSGAADGRPQLSPERLVGVCPGPTTSRLYPASGPDVASRPQQCTLLLPWSRTGPRWNLGGRDAANCRLAQKAGHV